MKNKRLLAGPYLFWSVSFVVIPLLVIVYYAFTSDEGTFTFSNLAQITTPENLKALGMSILLSFLSTAICLILAYPLAMILSQNKVGQTSFIVLIFILPMWMNFLLRTLAWQTLLEKNGVINSVLGFLHLPALEIINTPYAIIPTSPLPTRILVHKHPVLIQNRSHLLSDSSYSLPHNHVRSA